MKIFFVRHGKDDENYRGGWSSLGLVSEGVEEAKQLLETAREKLAEVMQERKVQENLKEKAFEEFLLEEKRQESKEIDQLTSYTYGQKIHAEDVNAEDLGNGR